MATKSAVATIFADRIVLAHPGDDAIVDTRLWRSPFGLIGRYLARSEPEFPVADDPIDDPSATDLVELPAAATDRWTGTDGRAWIREFKADGDTLAPLPRAVRWAVLLRALRDRAGLAPAEMGVRFAASDGAAADEQRGSDLLRAAALAEARVDAAECCGTDTARWIRCWSGSLSWSSLEYLDEGAAARTLISDATRLPARVRFGQTFRRSTCGQDAADVPLRFSIGGARMVCHESELQDLQGTLEFEATWHRHGDIEIDAVVDGTWRPVQRISLLNDDARVRMEAVDNDAAERPRLEFAALSAWRQVLSDLPVDVLPVFGLEPGCDGESARSASWGGSE